MTKDLAQEGAGAQPGAPPDRPRLSPAAERALAEAAARRADIDARVAALPKEHGASREAEPVRYGDWERKGLASDF
jgi:hypothetical protein